MRGWYLSLVPPARHAAQLGVRPGLDGACMWRCRSSPAGWSGGRQGAGPAAAALGLAACGQRRCGIRPSSACTPYRPRLGDHRGDDRAMIGDDLARLRQASSAIGGVADGALPRLDRLCRLSECGVLGGSIGRCVPLLPSPERGRGSFSTPPDGAFLFGIVDAVQRHRDPARTVLDRAPAAARSQPPSPAVRPGCADAVRSSEW